MILFFCLKICDGFQFIHNEIQVLRMSYEALHAFPPVNFLVLSPLASPHSLSSAILKHSFCFLFFFFNHIIYTLTLGSLCSLFALPRIVLPPENQRPFWNLRFLIKCPRPKKTSLHTISYINSICHQSFTIHFT